MGQGIVIGGRRIESGSGLDPDLRDRDDRTTVLTASLAVERPAVDRAGLPGERARIPAVRGPRGRGEPGSLLPERGLRRRRRVQRPRRRPLLRRVLRRSQHLRPGADVADEGKPHRRQGSRLNCCERHEIDASAGNTVGSEADPQASQRSRPRTTCVHVRGAHALVRGRRDRKLTGSRVRTSEANRAATSWRSALTHRRSAQEGVLRYEEPSNWRSAQAHE